MDNLLHLGTHKSWRADGCRGRHKPRTSLLLRLLRSLSLSGGVGGSASLRQSNLTVDCAVAIRLAQKEGSI